MPANARIIYDGAICHIIQRGNNKQKIFKKGKDYEKILSIIKEYSRRYAFQLYNYCLMPNHLHLLLKIDKKEHLAKLMQGILQTYRFYYKRKHKYIGYLYQGRYKSKIIEKESYLLECARYIERNPLRAGMVKELVCYKWTSYLFYAHSQRNDIITENPLYTTLSLDKLERRNIYNEYVVTPRAYEEILDKAFGLTRV